MQPEYERRALWLRIGLIMLILEGGVIGVWALFFPYDFYLHFFLGADWLPALGGYSEHLTRDAGALYLGITTATVYAYRKLTPDLVTGVCAANAVAAFPHMVYHIAHYKQSGIAQTIPQAGTLAATVALSIVLIFVNNRQRASWPAAPVGRPAVETAKAG